MNTTAICQAVELARSANRLATYHINTGHPERATGWRYRRDQHMTTARQLKLDQPRTMEPKQ